MKYINLEGAFCCTKHCKAPTSGYAAVHSDGSQGPEAWDKRYLRPRSPRPSRPLHAPPAGPRKVAMRPPPVPFGPALARRPGNSALDPPPPTIPGKAERSSPQPKPRPPQAASRRRQHRSAGGKVTRGSLRKRRSSREQASWTGRSSSKASKHWRRGPRLSSGLAPDITH